MDDKVIGYGLFENTAGDLFVGEWTMEDQRGHNIEAHNFWPDQAGAERALAETAAKPECPLGCVLPSQCEHAQVGGEA